MDIAMIGLMRDARLRVSEAADLTWGAVERQRGGSGRVRVAGADETGYREVSADTMKLLLPVRRGAGDDEPVLGMRPNQIAKTDRRSGEIGGPGRGLLWRQPPARHDQGHGDARRPPAGRLRRRERTPAVGIPQKGRDATGPDTGAGQESL